MKNHLALVVCVLAIALASIARGASSSDGPKLVAEEALVEARDFLHLLLFVPAGETLALQGGRDARWTCGDRQGSVHLEREDEAPAETPKPGPHPGGLYTVVRLRSHGRLPGGLEGPVLIELNLLGATLRTFVSVSTDRQHEAFASAADAIHAAPPTASEAGTVQARPGATTETQPTSAAPDLARRDATRVPLVRGLQVNEPVYFVINLQHGLHGLDARFQLSLKYQFFASYGPARHLNALFTTTSLWDLHSFSAPFRDSTYRPALAWCFDKYDDLHLAGARFEPDIGLEHESNGRGPDPALPSSPANDDELSRSMNRIFATPRLTWLLPDQSRLIFAPKIFAPILYDRVNNGDISRYRGYADVYLKWLSKNAAHRYVLSALYRQGTDWDKRYLQLDYGIPLNRISGHADTNGWLLFQWLYGYGETLRDYNVKVPGTVRVGLMIVP